jgi:glycosyltransferase involved in cell wall biosynthesis
MVLPALPHGGMEQVVFRLAIGLQRRGHDVSVICLERTGPLESLFRDAGIPVSLIPTPGLRTNISAPLLRAHLMSRGIEVVHSHSGVWLKAARAARAAGIARVIHTVHGLLDVEPAWGRWLKRAAATYTDMVVAVSDPLARYLRDACHIPEAKVVVLPNGVDRGTFAPIPTNSSRFLAARTRVAPGWEGKFLVAHVARLVPVKNQQMMLRAFRRVADDAPDARLIIAGEGPLGSDLHRMVTELALDDHVRFLGSVNDVHEWLPAMDAFALSSDAEGTSMSILESLSSGVPVVATRVGGNSALLADGEAGHLVPAGDATAFAGAILSMMRDPVARERMRTAGIRIVADRYGEEAVIEAYERLYLHPQLAHPEMGMATCAV